MLALLLSLLVIGFAAFALSRPFREGGGDTPKSLVILLDRSASMSAVDDKGRTRLDRSEGLAARASHRPAGECHLFARASIDAKAEVAQSRSTNRRELLRLIEQVQPSPVEDRVEEALAVGARLAALDPPSETWLASDMHRRTPSGNPKFLSVALDSSTNVGITGFQIRPAPLARNRFEAFVEVTAAAGESPTGGDHARGAARWAPGAIA